MSILMNETTSQDQVAPALDQDNANILRPAQLAELQQDIKVCEEQLKDPRVQDKSGVHTRLRNLKRNLEQQAPRPITDGRLKDKLATEAKTILEQITPGMLSQEEMRKNPAGSVDKFLKWERANKKKILRYKKLMLSLNADHSNPVTWDRDAANLEKFRPESAQDRFRTNAQIGGHMSYGSVSDENWQQAFGHLGGENSALSQVVKRVSEQASQAPSPEVKSAESTARKK